MNIVYADPFIADIEAELYGLVNDVTQGTSEMSLDLATNVTYSLESLQGFLSQIQAKNTLFISRMKNLLDITNTTYTTEYANWYADKARLVDSIERMEDLAAFETDIDIPTGMTCTYPEATELVLAICNRLDIFQVVGNVAKTADCVLTAIHQGSSSCENSVGASITQLHAYRSKIETLVDKLNQSFNLGATRHSVTVPFKTQFSGIESLKQCRTNIAEADKVLAKSTKLKAELNTIEERVGQCVDYLVSDVVRGENEYVPSTNFVQKFSNYLSDAEWLIGTYGTLSLIHMALVHNLSYVYIALKK